MMVYKGQVMEQYKCHTCDSPMIVEEIVEYSIILNPATGRQELQPGVNLRCPNWDEHVKSWKEEDERKNNVG